MNEGWREYLDDPLLGRLYARLREAGPLRSIVADLTHACNLRCTGCYFFTEDMDRVKAPDAEAQFDEFVQRELARGTNFITVVGGEPTLQMGRLKKLHDRFHLSVATNGVLRIPREGFEDLPIGVSLWGDHATDKFLRGSGKLDVFAQALENYAGDDRAVWYFTTSPGKAQEIESVVEQCIANGNRVSFSYYDDRESLGGAYRGSFEAVRREVERMIELHPGRVLTTSYLNEVATTNRMLGKDWGYDVCCTISAENPVNRGRIANGNPYNPHFRVYNPDLKSTRRCCVGIDNDCRTCYNVYARWSWVMASFEEHLGSEADFTNWLATIYVFYLANRIVDWDEGLGLLPEIHERLRALQSARHAGAGA